MKTEIKEVIRKNGKTQYDVYYNGHKHQECRTLKSAKAMADKFERFNGRQYATHLKSGYGRMMCNTRGDQDTTLELSKVTCPRCLAKIASAKEAGRLVTLIVKYGWE